MADIPVIFSPGRFYNHEDHYDRTTCWGCDRSFGRCDGAGPQGDCQAQATPQAPAPQAAAQAAPQGAPGCPGGNCQPIYNYVDYNCPYYYPVPYPVWTPIYNIYRRHYTPYPYYYPVCYYYNVNVGDYPASCPGGNCGPYSGAAPAASAAPQTAPPAP